MEHLQAAGEGVGTGADQVGAGKHLLLLQEATDAPSFGELVCPGHWHWQQVAAFRFEQRTAGVECSTRSCCLQLLLAITGAIKPDPKIRPHVALSVTQGSRYPLMVVNVHGINFEPGMAAYKKQLEQIGKLTRKYQGPVGRRRFQYLEW